MNTTVQTPAAMVHAMSLSLAHSATGCSRGNATSTAAPGATLMTTRHAHRASPTTTTQNPPMSATRTVTPKASHAMRRRSFPPSARRVYASGLVARTSPATALKSASFRFNKSSRAAWSAAVEASSSAVIVRAAWRRSPYAASTCGSYPRCCIFHAGATTPSTSTSPTTVPASGMSASLPTATPMSHDAPPDNAWSTRGPRDACMVAVRNPHATITANRPVYVASRDISSRFVPTNHMPAARNVKPISATYTRFPRVC